MGVELRSGTLKSGAFDKILKRIQKLTKDLDGTPSVAVGLPSNSLPYPDGTSVVQVAIWNEFGTSKIPERPFLRESLRQNRKAWIKLARQLHQKAIKDGVPVENLMRLLGERMQSDTQKSLDSGAWEPNAPAYAAAKALKGKTKPLIVTGHLRASIRWVMRNET